MWLQAFFLQNPEGASLTETLTTTILIIIGLSRKNVTRSLVQASPV